MRIFALWRRSGGAPEKNQVSDRAGETGKFIRDRDVSVSKEKSSRRDRDRDETETRPRQLHKACFVFFKAKTERNSFRKAREAQNLIRLLTGVK